ncbi:hypothetical protein CPB83DRAFT_774915 [Crepidotus variabilis]|uniref:SUZ domain-containing protein n=1 Tax=Crepidotus variabilis TaxID=179855 RepID=A0A9P6E7B7_9AGAR|nr:hypothetical protein CPB83DRAFT_774915 [Crepidotus variabilis]
MASSSGSASKNFTKATKSAAVCDDWEAEEDEEEADPRSVELQNKRIWEEANSRESRPMPAVVMSRGTSTSASLPTLPLNQPPAVRILKRPSGSPSQSSTNANTSAGDTLQDREARYQAARHRIFGTSVPYASPASSSNSLPMQRVIREPRGPEALGDQPNTVNKGFRERKGPSKISSLRSPETQALSDVGLT